MKVQTLTVAHRKAHPGGYVVLRFTGGAAEVEPGQFLMIRGDWGFSPLLPRPFSVAWAEGAEVGLLVQAVGQGSRRLAALQRGDVVEAHGPLGEGFRRVEGHERLLLVGGGVGIAPLLFLARRFPRGRGGSVTVVYGGRSRRDLPMAAELAAAADQVILATEDGSVGERGLVTVPMATLLGEQRFDRVMACGPTGMMAAAARRAVEAGVPCEVSLETAMACGYGICLGCVVPRPDGGYLYACQEGPVVDGACVDWDGLAATAPHGAPRPAGPARACAARRREEPGKGDA